MNTSSNVLVVNNYLGLLKRLNRETKKNIFKRTNTLFFTLLIGAAVSAQTIITPESIQDSVFSQLILFPQEKIHLHTDRTMYVPGDKIWFKAYIVDAFTHQSSTYSQYAYIELINSSDSLIHRVMVSKDENELLYGHIYLSDFIPEGDYTLRAYTRYMENMGDDYFFKKPVQIKNLKSDNKQKPIQSRADYDVSFFPEGGYLTEGTHCRVAFKALDISGAAESITGVIVDNEGKQITEIATTYAGMGSFLMIPERGKSYSLICKNSSGKEKRFRLPASQKTYSLVVYQLNKGHYIQVRKTPDLPEKQLSMLVHCKGEILYYDLWNYQKEYIYFSNKGLPSGIIQVVLLDGEMNPVSERLIFNKKDNQTKLVYSPDKPFYQSRERVVSDIFVTDEAGNPLSGHISVAITDDQDIAIDINNTIMSSLLLSSELRGYIESPAYYLQDNKEAMFALDLLMMSHGWRRYELSEVIKGNYRRPETGNELTKELSGSVRTLLLRQPVANGEVLFGCSDGTVGQTLTDSTGNFRFDLHYRDSVGFFVQAKNQKGKERVELVLKKEIFPQLKQAPVSLSLLPKSGPEEENQSATVEAGFLKKAVQRAMYDDEMRVINLGEVVVTAKRYEEIDKLRSTFWANMNSDRTFYRDEIESRNEPHLTYLLFGTAARIDLTTGAVLLKLGTPFLPLVFINGIPIEWDESPGSIFDSPLEFVDQSAVESIDIIKPGAGTLAFGDLTGRAIGGIISITTKPGQAFVQKRNADNLNIIVVNPLGYQQPVEYYAPMYDTPEAINLPVPDYRTTIFWKPDILVTDDGKVSFDFYSADLPTTYSVVIEGIANDGKIIRHVETIEVR